MAGTKSGGERAARRNKELYGEDFYSKIGTTGGKNSNNGGYGSEKVGKDGLTGVQRARINGAKGGRTSKRGKVS